jgi:predicted CopG family antitoxin
MAVKTITIKEEAYDALTGMKKSDESFSDVILRIGSEKKVTAKDLFGKLKISDGESKKMREELKKIHQEMNKEMEERYSVFTGHFSDV